MKSHSFFIFITEPYSVKEFQFFNRKNTKSFIQIFFKSLTFTNQCIYTYDQRHYAMNHGRFLLP